MRFGIDSGSLSGSGVPEEQGNAPDGGHTHQSIDDPAQGAGGAAEEKGHQIKAENTDAAPVESADDGKRQSDLVQKHCVRTSSDWNSAFSMCHEQGEYASEEIVLLRQKPIFSPYTKSAFFICCKSKMRTVFSV